MSNTIIFSFHSQHWFLFVSLCSCQFFDLSQHPFFVLPLMILKVHQYSLSFLYFHHILEIFLKAYFQHLHLKLEEKGHTMRMNACKDFNLAFNFLHQAQEGINLNLLLFRPTKLAIFGDVSEHNMGGFDLKDSTWHYNIPEHLRD